MKRIEKSNFNWKEKLAWTEESGRMLQLACTNEKIAALLRKADENYDYWDSVKEYAFPQGIVPEMFWSLVKALREIRGYKKLFFTKAEVLSAEEIQKVSFKYLLTPEIMQKCAALENLLSKHGLSLDEKNEFSADVVMEEAMASSRIEGSDTETEAAKEMLRSKRQPQNMSEQMILNTYKAMKFIEKNQNEPLSVALIKRLHLIIAKDCAEKSGVFRNEFDAGAITGENGAELFTPPPSFAIEDMLESLCIFANKGIGGESFHPVINAAIVHFWFAFTYPFSECVGRTARALFYWHMLKNGYGKLSFLSISKAIENRREQYGKTFLYAGADENDLTYFINFNLDIIIDAAKAFNDYAEKRKNAAAGVTAVLKPGIKLNPRQQSIMEDFTASKATRNIEYFKNKLGVVYETARTDLMYLAKKKLLVKKKSGKEFIYMLNTETPKQ